ncbi:HLA class II histocompatibility antigen, DP alpha 1 chain-like isoform X2 [Rhinichthys klamathensis goyatoka]|uniref:HLA class II histocompatibility antigen, DP alpha 1 chain-like isoform X2 n=1 Tax=Rhinichthys klamathensis goyatoka TaxID=3034132 RepID=UPI0024B5A1DF|nr:HLA class II histocompatibility antigen, DP alpha 1 chain-like isoform X2 [Rhinichthys klamathensis goyatoka]
MELSIIILALTVVLSTDAGFVHEDFAITICSDTEAEKMYGFDNEELWHADFNQKKGVETLPDFGDPMSFPGFFERSVGDMAILRSSLAIYIKAFKSPPPEMDAPETSIYPEDDVQLGFQNTLICHVTGFYPPSVSISWTKNNVNVTEGMSLSQYRPMNGGTFNIFSTLKFTPGEGDIYSCTVNHRALQGQPQTKTWDVDVALPGVGPAVFCGVGLTLGLLGVATGTFFLVKGNNCN